MATAAALTRPLLTAIAMNTPVTNTLIRTHMNTRIATHSLATLTRILPPTASLSRKKVVFVTLPLG